MEDEKRPDKNKIITTLYTLILVVLLIIIWGMNHAISTMQLQMNQLQQDINNLQSSISSQIDGITSEIDTSLNKANSIISDYSYRVQADKIDRKARTFPMSFTVRPKEDKSGMVATFVIETEDGKTISAPGVKGEASTYTATTVVPISNYLKLSVTFDDGTLQKSEKLEDIYQPFDPYIMKVDSVSSLTSTSSSSGQSKHKIAFGGTIDTTITQSSDGGNYPVDGEIQVFRNEKLAKTIPMQIEDVQGNVSLPAGEDSSVAAALSGSCTTYCTKFDETFSLKTNEVLKIVTVVKDNYGFRYKQTIYSESFDKDGISNPTNYSGEVYVE